MISTSCRTANMKHVSRGLQPITMYIVQPSMHMTTTTIAGRAQSLYVIQVVVFVKIDRMVHFE